MALVVDSVVLLSVSGTDVNVLDCMGRLLSTFGRLAELGKLEASARLLLQVRRHSSGLCLQRFVNLVTLW